MVLRKLYCNGTVESQNNITKVYNFPHHKKRPDLVVQAGVSQTADSAVVSSVTARALTFVEIGHPPPSADSRRVVTSESTHQPLSQAFLGKRVVR